MLISQKNLAAKVLFFFFLLIAPQAFGAGIPVFDGSNLSQTTISAIENVNQCITQLQQHATQLQQYEDQIRNSVSPPAYLWDQAQLTMSKMLKLQDQIDFYTQQAGSIDSYLNKFGDVNYYSRSDYFTSGGGKKEQLNRMREAERVGIAAQKRANDNAIRSLDEQQKQLRNDASMLSRLQSGAQSAEGRMEALQHANQFASFQSNQLLQIRAALAAQHAVVVAKAQSEQDAEARRIAADESAVRGSFNKVDELKVPKFSRK